MRGNVFFQSSLKLASSVCNYVASKVDWFSLTKAHHRCDVVIDASHGCGLAIGGGWLKRRSLRVLAHFLHQRLKLAEVLIHEFKQSLELANQFLRNRGKGESILSQVDGSRRKSKSILWQVDSLALDINQN